MSGGSLPGIAAEPPRKRGRPKGSTNRRAKDLKGLLDARYGGSAAQQSAALCMISPRELKAAGGSMAKAQVAKALDLVDHVRQAQAGLDDQVRAVVREALADLAEGMHEAKAAELRRLVGGFIGRVKEATSGFSLAQALKLLGDERAALLPYTDQKQPLAVQVEGMAGPSVVVMHADPVNLPMLSEVTDADFIEVLPTDRGQVSQQKSHDDQQTLALPGLEPLGPAD